MRDVTATPLTRRRVFGLAAVGAGFAAGATACSSGSDAGDPNSFEFWSFSGIGQKDDVDKYLAANPDITIKLTEVGSSVETAQALTTALAGGKVPDLALVQAGDLPKFILNPGNFTDLNTLGGDDISGDYLDWVIAQAEAPEGQLLGIPTDVGGMAVSYRTDLFAAAGLPTDRAAASLLWPTWEDFISTGQEFVAATGTPFVDNAVTSVFTQAVSQVGTQYYDADGNPDYDNDEVRAAFDLALAAIAAGITAKVDSFSEGWSAGMGKGAFAVIATPSWMLGSIKSNAPDTEGKWDLATIPGGSGNWGGSYLTIPAGAKNPQAAWAYITRQQSPEAQLEHFIDAGSLPTTPENYDKPELLDVTDPFFTDAPKGQIFTQAVLGLKAFPVGQYTAEIGTEFGNALKGVEQNGADPAKAWDTALANIKTAIGA